jgi:putative transposase
MKKAISDDLSARVGEVSPEFMNVADPLSEHLRGMVVKAIVAFARAEIDDALGADWYARETRGGYRHGQRERSLSTSFGPAEMLLPRARVFNADGSTREFQSSVIPHYSRRTREVDASILLSYLAGANTRRIGKAFAPMLKDTQLSKSSVSRVITELKRDFGKWATRSLADHRIAYLFLDAIAVPVKADHRSQQMAVLVALGVHETGERELVGLMLVATESGASWKTFIEDLAARDLVAPVLCVIDGHAGLRKAIAATWPMADVQRCVVHKLRNLQTHCPKKSWANLHADFTAIVEAPSRNAARAAYERFQRVWKLRCPAVVESLLEAGAELLTHYSYPQAQWCALRTTNAIERLNLEFRRRIKTQGSLPNESSVLYLFYGLWASGQIRLRKIDGWRDQEIWLAEKRGAGPSETAAATGLDRGAGRTRTNGLKQAV